MIELLAEKARLRQRQGGQPAQHQLQIAGVDGHPQLRLGGKRDGVARIFLGPALQQRAVGGVCGQFRIFLKDMRPEPLIEIMVKIVLQPDRFDKFLPHSRPDDFFRHDEVPVKQYVPLGFFRIGAKAEFFDFFNQQAGNADHVDVEDRVFGHRAVPHLENDVAVGSAGFFDFGPGVYTQLIHGPGAAADAGVGGGNRFRRNVLLQPALLVKLTDQIVIDVAAGQEHLHHQSLTISMRGSVRPRKRSPMV